VKENFHERHEGVTLAAGELFHDKVLLVLPQSSTAGDDEQGCHAASTSNGCTPLIQQSLCLFYREMQEVHLCRSESQNSVVTEMKVVTPAESKCSHTESK
jgi:hypothetical protein